MRVYPASASAQGGPNSTLPKGRVVTIDEEGSLSCCIDLSVAAREGAGLGRYSSSLAEALLSQGVTLRVFVNSVEASRLCPPLSELPTYAAGISMRPWRLRVASSYFGAPSVDRVFPHVSLFHATEHLLPKLTRAASVFTLHDTAFVHFPEYYLPRNRIYLRVMIPRFLRRADRVIAVSEYTRDDALRLYGLDPDKVEVIPEGVDGRFSPEVSPERVASVRERYGLPDRFILYLGTIQPRKNLTTLLEAFASIRTQRPQVGLVIAGERGWLYQPFYSRLRELGLDQVVTLAGKVADDDLPAMFNAAEVFAYPSVFEGFGLPPLEAMACGTPVVCSNASSLPEVVGDAGLLVAPRDVRAWVTALAHVLDDDRTRADLRGRGRKRALRFTWDAAAAKTARVYRSLARASRERR